MSPNPAVAAAGERSVQPYLLDIHGCLDERGPRPVIPLSIGDPSSAPSYRTAPEAVEAIATALRSGQFDGYLLVQQLTGNSQQRHLLEQLQRRQRKLGRAEATGPGRLTF